MCCCFFIAALFVAVAVQLFAVAVQLFAVAVQLFAVAVLLAVATIEQVTQAAIFHSLAQQLDL